MTKELLHQIINNQLYFQLFLLIVANIALNLVNFKLILKMLGVKTGFKKMAFEVFIMVCYCATGRLFLPDFLTYTLILLGLWALLLRMVNGISWIRAFWCIFLVILFTNIGALFLETLCIINRYINSFMFTPYGYAVGTTGEMLGPLILLFVLSKFKLSLVPSFRKRVTLVECLSVLLFGIIFLISCCTFAQMWPKLRSGSIHNLDSIVFIQWAGTIAVGIVAYLLQIFTRKQNNNLQRAHEEERNRMVTLIRELLNENNKTVADEVANKLKADDEVPAIIAGSKSQIKFTKIEYLVLRFIVQGMSNKEIGAALDKTENAIKSTVHSLSKKIGFFDRGQLGIWAVLNGLIKEEELSIYKREKEE